MNGWIYLIIKQVINGWVHLIIKSTLRVLHNQYLFLSATSNFGKYGFYFVQVDLVDLIKEHTHNEKRIAQN